MFEEASEQQVETSTEAQVQPEGDEHKPEVEEEQAEEVDQEKLLQEKKTQDRRTAWAKMKAENKRLAAIEAEYQKRQKDFEGVSWIDKWLRQDPQNIQTLRKMMQGEQRAPEQNQQSEYDQYDPFVSEHLKKISMLEQKLAQYEQQQEQGYIEAQNKNYERVNESFVEQLIKDGYCDAEGNTLNEEQVEFIEIAVRSKLEKIAQYPDFPTVDEMQKAYASVRNVFKAAEKAGVGNLVKKDPKLIPPTGSRNGVVPTQKKNLNTEQDIVNFLAKSL